MCRFRLQAEVRQRRRSLYEYAMRKRILVTNPASTARVLVDVAFSAHVLLVLACVTVQFAERSCFWTPFVGVFE